MLTTTTGRRVPLWAMVLVGAACALAAVGILGVSAQAQDEATPPLTIKKTIKPQTVQVGKQQVFTIKITNNTGARRSGVTMRDPLPQNVHFIRASTSLQIPGSCRFVQSNRTVVCGPYTLARGQSFTVNIYVKPTQAGKYLNTAHASYTLPGGLGAAPEASDSARHRAVKDRKDRKDRCGVRASGGSACVGGVKAGKGTAKVGGIRAR